MIFFFLCPFSYSQPICYTCFYILLTSAVFSWFLYFVFYLYIAHHFYQAVVCDRSCLGSYLPWVYLSSHISVDTSLWSVGNAYLIFIVVFIGSYLPITISISITIPISIFAFIGPIFPFFYFTTTGYLPDFLSLFCY